MMKPPHHITRSITGVVLIVMTLLPLGGGNAEVIRRQKVLFPLVEGTEVSYDTAQTYGFYMAYNRPAHYVTRILLHDVIGPQVRYEWWMQDHDIDPNLDTHGFSTVRGLDYGRMLDPWWQDGQEAITDRVELWISRVAFDEITAMRQADFLVDTVARGDTNTRIFLEGYATFSVRINGELAVLPVLKVRSSMGDTLLVYNSRENPFVLSADLPDIYSWNVTDITLPSGR